MNIEYMKYHLIETVGMGKTLNSILIVVYHLTCLLCLKQECVVKRYVMRGWKFSKNITENTNQIIC